MSSSSSSSDTTEHSDDSDLNYLSDYEREVEYASEYDASSDDHRYEIESKLTYSSDEESALCADDPVADPEWTAQYEEEMAEIEAREQKLMDRLNGETDLSEWCKCGNCVVDLLQNASECYCCTELEGCFEALQSEIVLRDFPPDTMLTCITEHPGFDPVCLQKWSLRQAAWKFKTKGNKRYKQIGTEESFLRSVSYREFSRLVYGVLGAKRIPISACAYNKIRKKFPVNKDEEYTGFEMDDDN